MKGKKRKGKEMKGREKENITKKVKERKELCMNKDMTKYNDRTGEKGWTCNSLADKNITTKKTYFLLGIL